MTQARKEGAGGNHPAEEDLVRFMRGELAPGEAGPIVRHLLAGCSRCSAVTRGLWSFGEPASNRRMLLSPFQAPRRVGVSL
jgi:hypothetical protein